MPELFSSVVEISRQFLRSVRVDTDFGRDDALQGYVCQGTARNLLGNMARQILETRQRAFTWTGPYGGGKSSLALVLCSLVAPDKKLRAKAKKILGLTDEEEISQVFAPGKSGWQVIPVVGKRDSVITEIAAAYSRVSDTPPPKKIKSSDLIAQLVQAAESRPSGGVLLVVDELGKFLESAAQTGEDIFFYQELAEAASRCNGKLVVVGILHQAFEQYATRLGREARDEWAKVQGRYVDISLVAASDEVIELISRAITAKQEFPHDETCKVVEPIADSIRRRRPGSPKGIADGLFRCWPLHPITAALLGPISKRRFGQNERSTFGFLASVEPLGFSEYLAGTEAAPLSMYGPARYWDYLRANMEPAILASPDGHRWAIAAEAVERAEVREGGSRVHVELTKTVALIDMFRNGSGLAAEDAVLNVAVANVSPQEVRKALEDLARWSIVIYRKHIDAWGIYAGSDFDIDAAVNQARAEIGEPDLQKLTELTDLFPVLAKRHYQEKGTMRWMTRAIVRGSEADSYISNYSPKHGSCGEFVLVIPSAGASKKATTQQAKRLSNIQTGATVLVGVPHNADKLAELGLELAALERVYSTRPELEGDAVARREIDARISAVRSELEEELRDAFNLSRWFHVSEQLENDGKRGLSPIASDIADTIFSATPQLFSELINRDSPSSNSVKARRDLLYRMLGHVGEKDLGYEDFPADAGLFYTLLKSTELYREDSSLWRFCAPRKSKNAKEASFVKFWEATTQLVAVPDKITSLDELYELWGRAPYGIRSGVMPILALAFFLANRQHMAMYIEGVFVPELTEAQLDEWLQDAKRISFRYVQIEEQRKELLGGLSAALTNLLGRSVSADPLDSARGLVALAFDLPGWTKRTTAVSTHAQDVRKLLLRASDPHKVLFNDLPVLFGSGGGAELVDKVIETIKELVEAYPLMLRRVEAKLLRSLDHSGDLEQLRYRGDVVKGITGDFRLDAFATRLSTYQGEGQDIEGLISLAVSKPNREWVDRDIDAAIMQIGAWAMDFRRAETLASLQDRPTTRRAIAIVFGTADGHAVSDSFDIAENETPLVEQMVDRILGTVQDNGVKREIILAALAEAGVRIVETAKDGE